MLKNPLAVKTRLKFLQSSPAYPAISTVKVFDGLNGVKGLFIFLVVLTHSLPPSMLLYFLYLSHMPVFLAIGGFLLKENVFKSGLRQYLKRSTFRLIVPWLIAYFIYLPLQLENRSVGQISVADFIYPFYHLWYIPAYILGSVVCYAVSRWKIPFHPVLFILAAFTFIWYAVYRNSPLPATKLPLYWLGDKRIYAYLLFFMIGFALRNQKICIRPLPRLLLFVMSCSSVLLVLFVYGHVPHLLTAIPYLLFNFSLVLFVLLIIGPSRNLQHRLWLLLNKQSLGIYLYHPIIMLNIYKLIGDPEKEHVTKLQGVGVGLLTLISVLSLVWLLKKWHFTNKYVLGNVKTTKRAKEGQANSARLISLSLLTDIARAR